MKEIKLQIVLTLAIIFVCLVHGLPNIILSSKLGNSFTPFTTNGLSPIARDETYAYAPFVNNILSGKFPLRDIYVFEYSKTPTPYLGETAPALLLAFLAKISGSVERSFIISDSTQGNT